MRINYLFKLKYFFATLLLILISNASFASPKKLNCSYFLEDEQRTMDADDVLKAWDKGQFNRIPQKGINPGFTKSAFWIAVELPKETLKHYYLRIGTSHINLIDFYEVINNKPTLINQTGDHLHFNSRPLNNRLFVFPLKSDQESNSLYFVRAEKHHESLQLTTEVFLQDDFYKENLNEQLISGIFFGIVFLIITFCAFQFIMLRDYLYVYFSSFVLFAFLWVASDKGYAYQLFWPDYPGFANRARPIFSSLFNITGLLFFKSFLQIEKGSKFAKLINICMFAGILPVFVFLVPIDYKPYSDFILTILIGHTIWGFITVVTMLWVVFAECLKKNTYAWFYLFSFFALIMLSTAELLIHSGSASAYGNYFSQFGIQSGVAFQIIILTFGLAHRFNVYREDRMNLLIKINDEQQEHSQRLMEVQENERRKIAEQLHDDVGTMLSVASLHITSLKGQMNENFLQQQEKLSIAEDVLQQVSSTVRNLSHILMPFNFEKHGFISAIRNLVTTINISGKIQVEQVIIGFKEVESYNKNALLEIYRMIQELLNNILKHSKGKNAYLELIEHEDVVVIVIEDNGQGIEVSKSAKAGKGVSNLFTKVAYFNGIIEVNNKVEGGTMIMIELPKEKLK